MDLGIARALVECLRTSGIPSILYTVCCKGTTLNEQSLDRDIIVTVGKVQTHVQQQTFVIEIFVDSAYTPGQGLTLTQALISNHMSNKMWSEIIEPFLNFNCAAVMLKFSNG